MASHVRCLEDLPGKDDLLVHHQSLEAFPDDPVNSRDSWVALRRHREGGVCPLAVRSLVLWSVLGTDLSQSTPPAGPTSVGITATVGMGLVSMS